MPPTSDSDNKLTPEQIAHFQNMIASMFHHLRNPTIIVNAFSEVFLRDEADSLNVDQRQYLLAINESSSLVLKIWEDFFDIFRVLNRDLDLVIATVNLEEIFEAAISNTINHWLAFKEKMKPSIQYQIPPEMPSIWADSKRIQQALTWLFLVLGYHEREIRVVITYDELWVKFTLIIMEDILRFTSRPDGFRFFGSRMIIEKHGGELNLEAQDEETGELKLSFTLPIKSSS